ncbi:hypothetical protein D3C85_1270610 [compost metagenome]
MKTVFLASVAAATLIAAPAFAQDAVGSAGLSYVNSDADGFETDGAVIDGSVATSAFGDWTVTLDGALNYSDSDGPMGDTTSAAAAHVSRIFKGVRVGGFAGFQNNELFDIATFGAEAQKTFQRATLTGSVSYSDFLQAEAWNVGADAAYYPMAALRLNAGVGYATIDGAFGGEEIESWTYGVGAEYRVAATPYSVFGRYETTSYDDIDLDVDTFKIGVRYNFGGSFQDQDRAGANIGRATRAPAALLGGI